MAKFKRKKQQSVADRLRWLAPHVEGFRAWLGRSGYSAATITELTRLLACWAEWVRNAGFDVDSIDPGLAASAQIFRGSRTVRAPQGAAKLFVTYLREEGILPPARAPRPEELWPVLASYRRWMREQRGVAGSRSTCAKGSWPTCCERSATILRPIRPRPCADSCSSGRGRMAEGARRRSQAATHRRLPGAHRAGAWKRLLHAKPAPGGDPRVHSGAAFNIGTT